MKNLKMEDFLSSAQGGNVVNFEKQSVLDFIEPTAVQLYYSEKGTRWVIAISNDENKRSMRIGVNEDIKVPKAIQDAVDAGNVAASILKVTPADKNALKTIAKSEGIVVPFVAGLLDDAEHYIYGGETENGRWLRLSPNAPGVLNVATYAFAAVTV